jgi:aminopeptidase N
MQIYLTKNAYKTTDIHHLRHAMEEASGQDLQVFFKEWFEGFGHPILDVRYGGKGANGGFKFEVNQIQDSSFQVFHLSSEMMLVVEDINGAVYVYKRPVFLANRKNVVEVTAPDTMAGDLKLLGYWIDPSGNLPAVIKEEKSPNFWLNQLKLSDNYLTKMRSVEAIGELNYGKERFLMEKAIAYCLDQPEYFYQTAGISMVEKQDTFYPRFARRIEDLALHGLHPAVRDDAIYLIAYMGDSAYSRGILLQGLSDSSYKVKSTSLQALAISDLPLCLQKCKEMEQHKTAQIQRSIAWLYAAHAMEDKNDYYKEILGKYGFYRNSIMSAYGTYLRQQNAAILRVGLQNLAQYYSLNSDREKGKQMLQVLKNLEAKSAEKAVFKEADYTNFYHLVSAEAKAN